MTDRGTRPCRGVFRVDGATVRKGGVIASEAVRRPLQALHPATRAGLVELARERGAMVLRWAR